MPRIKTITLYKYDELSDAAKAKARDWYRVTSAEAGDNDFAVPIIDDFKTCAAYMGWDVEDVNWSGFSSQGDGAQFVGRWRATNVDAAGLKRHAPVTDAAGAPVTEPSLTTNGKLHAMADRFAAIAAADPQATARVKGADRYCHEMATEFTVEVSEGTRGSDTEENAIIDTSRDLMRWLYRSLESEYDYVNADEQVADDVRANEYEFTAEGKFES